MIKAIQVIAEFEEVMIEDDSWGWKNCLDELGEPENRIAKEAMGKY